MTIQLNRDFAEFLRLLNSRKAEYLVVGGYALAFLGYPRTTGDLDIWIPVNRANSEKIRNALLEFGFEAGQLDDTLLDEKDKVIRMGYPPFRIELLTGASGVIFEQCYARKWVYKSDDLDIDVISLDDIIVNKRASGRAKDLADLEILEKKRDS